VSIRELEHYVLEAGSACILRCKHICGVQHVCWLLRTKAESTTEGDCVNYTIDDGQNTKKEVLLNKLGVITKKELDNSSIESTFSHLHLLMSYTTMRPEEKQENKT
jgi:hypothetical protein